MKRAITKPVRFKRPARARLPLELRGDEGEKVQNGACTLGQYYSKPTVLLPIIHVIPELISAIQL